MTTETEAKKDYEGWVILELMGHRKLAGYLTIQEIAGVAFMRIDVPAKPGGAVETPAIASQFYSPAALYCMTPVTEEVARTVAASQNPEPVTRWDVRALLTPAEPATPTRPRTYHDPEDDDDGPF